jgi:murein L,D-transpeptidase YafK
MHERRIQFAVVLILALCCAAVAAPIQADKIVILKSTRSMTLFSGGKVLKTYKVALGSAPVGPKRVEGDHKTLRVIT